MGGWKGADSMKGYTGAGDSGRSGTRTRRNIPKDSPVFELMGTLEECAGLLALAQLKAPQALSPILEELQENLAALGGEMAGEGRFATAERVARLEKAIDSLNEQPLMEQEGARARSEGGAALDIARAVARRAERKAVAMSAVGGVGRDVIAWLNRLSDLLWAVARLCDRTQAAPDGLQATQAGAPAGTADAGLCGMASGLCARVIAKAREEGLQVVAAVCDAGGNLVCLMRDDGAYLASIDVAMGKAYTSAALKMDTCQVGRMVQPGGPLYGLQQTNGGRIVAFGGGVPLTEGGRITGALGVSGGTPEQDAALAQWGAENFLRK